jgi:chromosome segregation protein
MIIKKLELQGFKSFPERTKIIFHTGITAIIGPNGTGKSNIVDAILWVLGGQRQKGLRVEKTEDIIFNGNTKKPPLGMADVTLSLEHQEEEIIITHRAFRSGESEYRLNGKSARLKDIQDTLWKRAVAEKEYFVIEQGSVGSLLTSKPAEQAGLERTEPYPARRHHQRSRTVEEFPPETGASRRALPQAPGEDPRALRI